MKRTNHVWVGYTQAILEARKIWAKSRFIAADWEKTKIFEDQWRLHGDTYSVTLGVLHLEGITCLT